VNLNLLQVRINLNDRSIVRFPREHNVVTHTEQQNRARDNDSKVHLRNGRVVGRRPAAEEDDEEEVADGDDVVCYAERAFQTPGAPDQAAVIGLVDLAGLEDGHGGMRVVEVAAETAPEEQADGEEIGEVEALKDHGDGAVEGGGVDDVD
jgi:hypothetical protein